jgi:hypothetical protein
MRFVLGMIVGAALTILGVYIADARAARLQQPVIVNWDVVSKKLDTLTADLQSLWSDFTREITGPP